MSFFQNPFTADFNGNWVLSDRRLSLRFDCPRNSGRGDTLVVAWNEGTYDLSGVDADSNDSEDLTIRFAIDSDLYKNWITILIDVQGATAAATTASEIITALNADATFASYFTAKLEKFDSGTDRILISQKLPVSGMRFYIVNGGAEEKIQFNARAGVTELPVYFMRHSVGGTYRLDFADAQNMLVYLDPGAWAASGETVAGDVINDAAGIKGKALNYDPTTIQDDYLLLEGRASGLFSFYKNTVNSDNQITVSIQYPAGAKIGDLAKKVTQTFTGTQTEPDTRVEEPHVIVSADILTP